MLRPEALPHVKSARLPDGTSAKLAYRCLPEVYVASQKLSEVSLILRHSSTGASPEVAREGFESPVHLHRLIPASLWETRDPTSEGLHIH